jgi:hypothetical protein
MFFVIECSDLPMVEKVRQNLLDLGYNINYLLKNHSVWDPYYCCIVLTDICCGKWADLYGLGIKSNKEISLDITNLMRNEYAAKNKV